MTQETFEQKLMERIRASIGELMTDADLKNLVERGMDKALFEPQRIKGRYGDFETRPPFVQTVVAELLKEQMRVAVAKWVEEHPDQVAASVEKAVTLGAGGCLMEAITFQFQEQLHQLRQGISEKL